MAYQREDRAKLEEDIKLMWQTYKRPDGSGGASTDEAVEAARRVFTKINLIGMTRSEVVKKLGDPQKAEGAYLRHPAHRMDGAGLIYVFATGIFGWQAGVFFDDRGKVREVRNRIIE